MKNKGYNYQKRGQIEYLLQNAFRIGFTIIAILAFFLLINFYVNNKIDTRYVQAETIANRIINSDAIMLQDPVTLRIYSGIVDMNKFSDANSLDKSIKYEFNRHAAARVKIERKDIYKKITYVGELYLNKNNWDNLKTLIDSGVKGKGSASMLIKDFPVTCAYDSELKNYEYCIMTVEVIVPNS
ncbi:MAG: hypothetical protein KatS3mg002_0489 [Candidatus Woesearchaeota archaeon]|nr:MAG: hypothetical protein KatS3mg002_0489 [Candidatus Woesearchaeota archaeon]